MPIPVLILLILIAVTGTVLLFWGIAEPRILSVTRTVVGSGSSRKARILFFSDLHAEYCFIPAEKICELIKAEEPDIVIFGGDIINDPEKWEKGRDYLLKIRSCCDSRDIPFAGVTGNHDIMIDPEDIASCGFTNVAENTLMLTCKSGENIAFNGVKDSGRMERVWYVPKKTEGADMTVTVAHNPDAVLFFPDDTKFDLLLSGHIHGGQIRTPLRIEFTVLRKDILPKKGIISGLHEVNGKRVLISKGIGCVALPFRIGAKPEVNIIDILT